jgi:hypothetical protein
MAGAVLLGPWSRKRRGLPEIHMLNLLYEQAPENIEDQTAIIQRAGLADFGLLAGGALRGAYRKDGSLGGDVFFVAGETLYRVTSAGVATSMGTIPGAGPVSIDGNASIIGIANGAGLYSCNGSTVSTVSVPDSSGGVSSIIYLLGYFLVSSTGTHKIHFSNVGLLVFDEIDFFSAEFFPDALVGMLTQTDFVWMLGKDTIEVWSPRADPDRPFYRMEGRLLKTGAAHLPACLSLDGSVFYVGTDRSWYRAEGTPTKISDHSLDQALAKADLTTLWAFPLSFDGHTCVALRVGELTFVYDLTTGRITRFASYQRDYWRPRVSVRLGDGSWLLGDSESGQVWKLDADANTDAGAPIIRRLTGSLEIANYPERCSNVVLWCSLGSTPDLEDDPQIGLDWSDDGGRTWGGLLFEPLGRQGEFPGVVIWSQLGLMTRPRRDFLFEVTDDVAVTFTRAKFNTAAV